MAGPLVPPGPALRSFGSSQGWQPWRALGQMLVQFCDCPAGIRPGDP